MNFFFDLVIGGLSIGACYALVALAMVIIYKTSEVPNFAQGEMAMISTFIAFTLMGNYGAGFWTSAGITLLFALILGVVLEVAFLATGQGPEHPRADRDHPRRGDDPLRTRRLEMGGKPESIPCSLL